MEIYMDKAYLFVHFREISTPEGEQVRFGLSRDGFNWESVNEGRPILWAYYGDKGVRDFTVVRSKIDKKFYIIATDLSLAYSWRKYGKDFWSHVSRYGSKCLSVWESEDLVNWTEQRLARIGNEDFGCLWAPDVIFDEKAGDYVIHWSSSHISDKFEKKGIWYSRTRDFVNFTEPKLLYKDPEGGEVIDSAIYFEGGRYYMFLKSHGRHNRCRLLVSDELTGSYEPIERFDECMMAVAQGKYEAPTAVKISDGRWCLFLDFYGASGAAQGYVPFVSGDIASGEFIRADEKFSFPYGFKHGTILEITMEEYERIKAYDFGRIIGW